MADMRTAFEADYFGDLPEVQARERSGSGYKYSVVQSAWSIWRAAWDAALASPPVAVQEERDAWEQIEIPPTNGVLKLFCDMKAEALKDMFFVDWMVDGKFCMDRQRKATHWMDLPDYPAAAMKGDQP